MNDFAVIEDRKFKSGPKVPNLPDKTSTAAPAARAGTKKKGKKKVEKIKGLGNTWKLFKQQ